MKIYSFNSFAYCTNIAMVGSYWFANTREMYDIDAWVFHFSPDYNFMFYYAISISLSSLLYTYGSFLEIYITWGRIQVFKPNYKFLLTTSVFIIVIHLSKENFRKILFV